jgi:DNA-binding transcriptional LysR family regulator
MDRFGAMSVFLQVVEDGSLSAAGRSLNLPLTTVSRKISDLEAHLGARLLIRSNRSATLTEAGQSYMDACKRILSAVAEAELAASGAFTSARGELAITAPLVFGRLHVVPVLTEFLHAYPDIDIRLTLADRLLHLHDDHVDLAVRIGTLPDSSLMSVKVGSVRRVVCASPAYLATHGAPLVPEDLCRHRCITFTGLDTPERWAFRAASPDKASGERTVGVDRAVRIRSRLAVNTAEAAIDAAKDGLGLTRVLSYQMAAAEDAGLLTTVLHAFEPAGMPVSLVFDGQGALPLKMRALLDFAAERLRERLRTSSNMR